MRLAILAVLTAVLFPGSGFAQDRHSFVEGFGGLRLAVAPSVTPTAGATIGVGVTPNFQFVGEVGHMSDVLPSTIESVLVISPVGFHTSALYGEGGARWTTGSSRHVGAYGEALAGFARLTNSVSGLDSSRNQAIADLALRFVNGTDPLAAVGTGVIVQGGPLLATIGYRYTRIFTSNAVDALLTAGRADVSEARVSFGVRF